MNTGPVVACNNRDGPEDQRPRQGQRQCKSAFAFQTASGGFGLSLTFQVSWLPPERAQLSPDKFISLGNGRVRSTDTRIKTPSALCPKQGELYSICWKLSPDRPPTPTLGLLRRFRFRLSGQSNFWFRSRFLDNSFFRRRAFRCRCRFGRGLGCGRCFGDGCIFRRCIRCNFFRCCGWLGGPGFRVGAILDRLRIGFGCHSFAVRIPI